MHRLRYPIQTATRLDLCLTRIALSKHGNGPAHQPGEGEVKSPFSLFYLAEYCPHAPPAQMSGKKIWGEKGEG